MNFIRHIRTAFELLAARDVATPHHVSLYVVLFSQWNEARFPAAVMLVRAEVMRAAHIGSASTYLKCLRELTTFGLITYLPSKSEHRPSRCLMHELLPAQLTPEVAQAPNSNPPLASPTSGASTSPKSGASTSPKSDASTSFKSGASTSPKSDASTGASRGKAVVSLDKQVETKVNENKPVLSIKLYVAAVEKKGGSAPPPAGQLSVPDEANLTAPGPPPKVKVAPKRKGPAAPPRPRRPEVPFAHSELATPEAFAAAFAGTDYEFADLCYYHEVVTNWRKDGEPPLRRDWLATAKRFMLNDSHDGRLKLHPSQHPSGPHRAPLSDTEFGKAVDDYVSRRYGS